MAPRKCVRSTTTTATTIITVCMATPFVLLQSYRFKPISIFITDRIVFGVCFDFVFTMIFLLPPSHHYSCLSYY